jgi:ribosome-binding factor A
MSMATIKTPTRVWKDSWQPKEYIRHELVERLHLRRAPELYFRLDRAEQEKARVEELLARAKKRKKARKAPVEKKA